MEVGRIRTVPFSSDSPYEANTLLESQAEAQKPTNHNASYHTF